MSLIHKPCLIIVKYQLAYTCFSNKKHIFVFYKPKRNRNISFITMDINQYKQITSVSEEDLRNSINEKWMSFSPDYKRLLEISNNKARVFRIPEGVEVICDNAFDHSYAETIQLPSTLKAIGEKAFVHIWRFNNRDFPLPENVEYVADNAFIEFSPFVIITSKLLYWGKGNCKYSPFIIVPDNLLDYYKKLQPKDKERFVSLSYYNEYKEAEKLRNDYEQKLKDDLKKAGKKRATPEDCKRLLQIEEQIKGKWPMKTMELSFQREFILKSHNWKYSVVKGNNGKGVVSCSGHTVADFKYDKITCKGDFINSARIIAERNGIFDIYYLKGDECLCALLDLDKIMIYDDLLKCKDLIVIEKDAKYGIVGEGKIILPIEYDVIEHSDKSFTFSKNGLWGCATIDETLTLVYPSEYESISIYNYIDAFYFVLQKNKKYKITSNRRDRKDTPFVYDKVERFPNGDFKVGIGNKFGVMNQYNWGKDDMCIFDDVIPIIDHYYKYRINGKFDIFNLRYDVNTMRQPEYDEIENWRNVFYGKKGNLWGAINGRGVTKEFAYDRFEKNILFKGDKQILLNDDKFYDSIELFSPNSTHYKVMLEGKYGIINNEGIVVLKPEYDEMGNMEHYTLIVRKGDKYGCLANSGRFSGCNYDSVRRDAYGYVEFLIDGEWKYLDRKLRPTQYVSMSEFGPDHLVKVVYYGGRGQRASHMPYSGGVIKEEW